VPDRNSADAIPDHRVPDILSRAAEIDRDRLETSSVDALKAVALDAGISLSSLETALEEYAREERSTSSPTTQGKDTTTGVLLSIFLGGFGAHRFYLGQPGIGLIYLLFVWTLIPSLLGLFEAFFMPERVRAYNRREELVEAVRAHRLLAAGEAKEKLQEGERRIPCPQCAERILPEAKICRFCGSVLT
jgi:TM2 domain-containing membrane protein YozV